MQVTLSRTSGLAAFKEWAVSVNALGQGTQVMLFRKGGIREKNQIFEVDHPHFFLYPTYEHQDASSVKPAAQGLLEQSLNEKPDLGRVTLRYWAKVEQAAALTSMEPVLKQADNHLFSESCIRYRWEWQSAKPLWLLLLRVYKLEAPLDLEVHEDYTGCKSWVDLKPEETQLPALAEGLACSPVLDDAAFESMAKKVQALL